MSSSRHPKGSHRGGQFAPNSLAAQSSADHLTLKTDLSKIVYPKRPMRLSDLEERIDHEEFRRIAERQMPITDTAAELWHITEGSRWLSALRGNPMRKISALDVMLAQNLQTSILASTDPCLVYRGIKKYDEQADVLFDTLEVGSLVSSVGFWSASTDPYTAQSFASHVLQSPTSERSAVLRIEAPLGKFLMASTQRTDHLYEEHEVVLPHGTLYQVTAQDEMSLLNGTEVIGKMTVFTLGYVGLESDAADELAHIPPNDTDDAYLQRILGDCLKHYSQQGFPLGDKTSLPY